MTDLSPRCTPDSLSEALTEKEEPGMVLRQRSPSDSEPSDIRCLLLTLWLGSAFLRFLPALILTNPFIFIDELWYWQMARSFHRHGHFLLLDLPTDIPSKLYPMLISVGFAFREPFTSYVAAKAINSLVFCAVVFPAYWLAREVLGREESLAASILSLMVTGGAYSATIMADNLFYPLFVLCFWLGWRSMLRPTIHNGMLTGIAFSVSYFAKPHTLILVISYCLCLGLYLTMRFRDEGKSRLWGTLQIDAFACVLPLFLFALTLGAVFISSTAASPMSRLMGDAYAAAVRASGTAIRSRHLIPSVVGLLLVLSLSTAFMPVFALPLAITRLKYLPKRQWWFCVFTTVTLVSLLGIITRHTLLNDESVRIHERYVFGISPALFIVFFLFRKQWQRRSIAFAYLGVGLCTVAFWLYAPSMLSWATTSDSPAFTGFFVLFLQHRTNLFMTTIFLFFGLVAVSVPVVSRRLVVLVTVWSLSLCLLNAGWYNYEERILQPAHDKYRDPVIFFSREIRPKRIAVIVDDLDPNVAFYAAFWSPSPVRFYSLRRPSELWFANYAPNFDAIAGGVNGEPIPDYIMAPSRISVPYPAVKSFPVLGVNIYKNQVLVEPSR